MDYLRRLEAIRLDGKLGALVELAQMGNSFDCSYWNGPVVIVTDGRGKMALSPMMDTHNGSVWWVVGAVVTCDGYNYCTSAVQVPSSYLETLRQETPHLKKAIRLINDLVEKRKGEIRCRIIEIAGSDFSSEEVAEIMAAVHSK